LARSGEEPPMARMVAEVMTQDPICASADCPVSEAARRMADADVGAVLVVDAEQVVGLCTDRDITVRVTAANRGPRHHRARDLYRPHEKWAC
jgi:CBS domain-containing protein